MNCWLQNLNVVCLSALLLWFESMSKDSCMPLIDFQRIKICISSTFHAEMVVSGDCLFCPVFCSFCFCFLFLEKFEDIDRGKDIL